MTHRWIEGGFFLKLLYFLRRHSYLDVLGSLILHTWIHWWLDFQNHLSPCETAASRSDAPAFGKLLLWVRNGVLWPQKYNLLGKLCTAERCLPGMIITPKFTGESRCKPKSTTQFFGGIFLLTMCCCIWLSWNIYIAEYCCIESLNLSNQFSCIQK